MEEPAIAAPKRNRVNREINIPEVRLIGADGNQVGVVNTREAIAMAEEAGLDLVEIVPTSEPPVCRLMDFGRFLFDQKKKKNEAKKKQKQVQIKEVKFRPGTDEGDYQVKLRNLTRFLNEGDKAKVTMRFRGREHAHRELGLELLRRIESDLAEFSIVEQQPLMEGRQMVMVLGPKKK
ncbi:translation initiation factor IF-3 [Allochromatium vinosum]|uniref:Translation initiation factor IF-3 n=1 Tax=Allochromatium vinosum (strain ATCC 17899 / DSM 180 / NBRC 103801 / NCIMB 10441 / D) TaxID=572477 RepID=D3RRM0_ALLVD|nr:translation initiation factor IF-3 [Allochromatium vinosum]ADC61924.1 translation initiation factor IF-3 [Allochromatium vinosum DSM 180]